MKKSLDKLLDGYKQFRGKYASGDRSIMATLSDFGQKPEIMIVACCDSRVDPALILQCDPGDLFVVRNVANIVPIYEKDEVHHGTSAALEFGIKELNVKHLILLGHSQCGGIKALLSKNEKPNDFINNWVSLIKKPENQEIEPDECAKWGLNQSYQNCLTFPWIKNKVQSNELTIHLWFFAIHSGQIFSYNQEQKTYIPLNENTGFK